jgi:hypothetical protein
MWGSPGYEPIQKLRQGRHREFPDTYLHARHLLRFFWSIHKKPSIEAFGAGLSENEGFPSEMYSSYNKSGGKNRFPTVQRRRNGGRLVLEK